MVDSSKNLSLFYRCLCQYDCVSFYNLVNSLRTTEKAMESGGWILHDSADKLYKSAHKRVYGNKKKNENSKTQDSGSTNSQGI